MIQFLSINYFSWIFSIFVGFFKRSHFLCHPILLLQPAKLRPQHKLYTPFLPLSEQNPPSSFTEGEAPEHVTSFWHAMRLINHGHTDVQQDLIVEVIKQSLI